MYQNILSHLNARHSYLLTLFVKILFFFLIPFPTPGLHYRDAKSAQGQIGVEGHQWRAITGNNAI